MPPACHTCEDGGWVEYGNCGGGCPCCDFCSDCWCTTCPITGGNLAGPNEVYVGRNTIFAVTINTGGAPCGYCDIEWSGGGEPATQEGGAMFITYWDTIGEKTVTATSSSCSWSFSKEVTVFTLDLSISGVPDEQEAIPGKYIVVNNDDDDANGVPDRDNSGPVIDENDLVEITLSTEPELHSGIARLARWGGGTCPVKVWQAETKGVEVTLPKSWDLSQETLPAKLYVEGYRSGDVALELSYNERASQPDTVVFHVVDIIYPGLYSKFTFTSDDPGILSFTCRASYCDELDMDQYVWTIDDIGEAQRTWDPSTAHGEAGSGRISTVTFTDLPANNSSFGEKRITLSYNYDGISFTIYRDIKVFFPRDATNNPGGTTPNWYYYWEQTGASSGSHQYDGSKTSWYGYYWPGDTHFYICPLACGYNDITEHDGIDTFAETCLHEKAHMDYFLSTWGTWANYLSRQPTEDQDEGVGDMLKDSDEPGMGYDPTKIGTLTNQYRPDNDFEDYASTAEFNWTKGLADNEDWALPGHQ